MEDPDRAGVEDWSDALFEALAEQEPAPLPLAEEAVRACPGDPDILLLASLAALVEHRADRCLRFLKRLERRYHPNRADHLLRALALAEQGSFGAAERLLERHAIATFASAWPWLPGGWSMRGWLGARLTTIRRGARREKERARPARAPAAPETAVGTRPATGAEAGPPDTDTLPRFEAELPIRFETHGLDGIARGLPGASGAPEEAAWFGLREGLARLTLLGGFDELLCLPALREVDAYWYQQETVRKVLKRFRGRVLLADEVGLGKTIEAGMVLKEYLLRGMVERFLILTPASLVGQWREEMERKFDIACATSHDPAVRREPERFWSQPRVIASIATARRKAHAAHVTRQPYDLVIVDEAHHLRNRSTANYRLVDALQKRFLLLLSATPVHNSLVELYNLLTLLKPGIFKTEREFRAAYVTTGRPRLPSNRERLHELMRDVMVRNTRALVDVRLPPRQAATLRVDPGPEEAACYQALDALARELHAGGTSRHRLAVHHLLHAAGASPAAATQTLTRFAERHPEDPRWASLAARYAALASGAKEDRLLELVSRNPGEKTMVFVQHRATLAHLGSLLEGAGVAYVRFEGSLPGPEKDAAIGAFRDHVPVLLCTGSGAEGRNVQFCHTLVNFDLPWSPMAIEQRIGRVHRIGQTHEVFVFNLVLSGSVEDHLVRILDEKIQMFELVVGEIDAILGEIGEPEGFEEMVLAAWTAATVEGRERAFETLGERLVAAKRSYDAVKVLDEELFGDELASE